MPIGEIAGEILGGVIRFVGEMIGEAVLEIGIRGPGYFLCRQFKRDIDPDSGWVLLAGIGIWVCIGIAGYFLYPHFFGNPAIGSK